MPGAQRSDFIAQARSTPSRCRFERQDRYITYCRYHEKLCSQRQRGNNQRSSRGYFEICREGKRYVGKSVLFIKQLQPNVHFGAANPKFFKVYGDTQILDYEGLERYAKEQEELEERRRKMEELLKQRAAGK